MDGAWVGGISRPAAVLRLAGTSPVRVSVSAQAHAALQFAPQATEGAASTAPKKTTLVFDGPVQPTSGHA